MIKTYICFLVAVLLSVTTSQAAIRYNITDLGTLPGYDMSRVWSINNRGQIVGDVFNSSSPHNNRAVLFDSTGAGKNIDLGTLGGENSWAASINNNGQIVGAAENGADPSTYRTTIFDPNGSGNNTGFSPESAAWDNNDNGQIIGWITFDTSASAGIIKHAALFLLNPVHNVIDLGTLVNFDSSEASSINNNGTIIGTVSNSGSQYYWDTRPVRFDPTGDANNIDLGTLPGYECGLAFSINDKGQIVGRVNRYDMSLENYYPRAVLFDPTGQGNNIDLGALPGYDSAEALSINNKGRIVGRAFTHENKFFWDPAAVLFDPTGNGDNINLNDLIDPTLGYDLETAICINDNAWIVCWGEKSIFDSTVFLLKPISAGPADFQPDGTVDLKDYAILAAAWRSTPADDNWNTFCDISDPKDDLIDERDLAVLAENYLIEIPCPTP